AVHRHHQDPDRDFAPLARHVDDRERDDELSHRLRLVLLEGPTSERLTMGRMLIDSSGNVKGTMSADQTDGTLKKTAPVADERLIAAVAMVLRDEINTLRTLGLIGLAARSVDDIVTAINAKL